MSEINLKLKSYDELIFEIATLNTNKYLLEQKVNKQKEVLDKIKAKVKDLYSYADNEEYVDNYCKDILKLLEEIE